MVTVINISYSDKRECTDLLQTKKWKSEGHEDNKPSNKKFKHDVDYETLCQTAKDIDHMIAKGQVKDFNDFKKTATYVTATDEQKKCFKDAFKTKNLADYELSYCGWYED